MLGAPLCLPAEPGVLAAPVAALALHVPQDQRREELHREEHAVGAGRRSAEESDERMVSHQSRPAEFSFSFNFLKVSNPHFLCLSSSGRSVCRHSTVC